MIVCTCDLEGIEDLGPGLPVSAYKALQAQCLAHGARLEAGAVRMSGSTEWRTPPEFFAKLHAEFGFNVDAAATVENALVIPEVEGRCSRLACNMAHGRYYTAETDGTKREHYGPGDVVWCNPPYSPAALLYRFVETAALTSREQGALWVMLLNATTLDTRMFHDFVWDRELHRPRYRTELRILQGRLKFLEPDGKSAGQPRHG